MAKIYINKQQEKLLKEAMEIQSSLPTLPLFKKITGRDFDLANNACFPSYNNMVIPSLYKTRYEDILSTFKDDVTKHKASEIANNLSKLTHIIQAKERNISVELEKIASNALVEIFDIPEDCVDIDLHIDEGIDVDRNFHIYPDSGKERTYDSCDDIEGEQLEVDKRNVLNALVMGATTDLLEKALKKIMADIFDLDEDLPHLYSRYIKINDYLSFITDIKIDEKNHRQGGYVDVFLGNDIRNAKVEAHGMLFPILLHEAIRGMLELCTSNGLPDDINIAHIIIDKCDTLINEAWNKRIGPSMWKCLNSINQFETNDIPLVLSEISKIDTHEFISIFKEVFAKTKRGNDELDSLLNHIRYKKDYSSFEDDMMKREQDSQLISDSYFTEEELSEYVERD